MSKKLLEGKDISCKICNSNFKRLEELSKHLKRNHNLDNITYTIDYLLDGEIPKCLCGCG